MQALGLDVLFKGSNLLRLLGGLWKALEISLIAVALSLILGDSRCAVRNTDDVP